MEKFTCAFFGHRDFNEHLLCEEKVSELIKHLINGKEYAEFLVGRNGEFDCFVSSVIRCVQRRFSHDNCSLTLVLPYVTSEYMCNKNNFHEYYDEKDRIINEYKTKKEMLN